MPQENMMILDSEKEEKFTESEKMIECLKSGDDEAFSKFYESYKAPLYDFLSKRTKHSQYIEDIISETFMAAVKNIDSLRDAQKFEQWLKAIAVNEMYAYIKKENKHSENRMSGDYSEIAEVVDDETIMLPEDFSADEEKKQLVADAVNSLSETQREAIYCYYYMGMSISEIAQMTNVSENTVKSRMLLAKKHLKRRLEKLKKQGYMFSAFPISVLFVELGDMVNVSFLTTASVATFSSLGLVGGISAAAVSAAVFISVSIMANLNDDEFNIDNTRGNQKFNISQSVDLSGNEQDMPIYEDDDTVSDSLRDDSEDTSHQADSEENSSPQNNTSNGDSFNNNGGGASASSNSDRGSSSNSSNRSSSNSSSSSSDSSSKTDKKWEDAPLVNNEGESVEQMVYRYYGTNSSDYSHFIINAISYYKNEIKVEYSYEEINCLTKPNGVYPKLDYNGEMIEPKSNDINGTEKNFTAVAIYDVPKGFPVENVSSYISFEAYILMDKVDDYGEYVKSGGELIPKALRVPANGNYVIDDKLNMLDGYKKLAKIQGPFFDEATESEVIFDYPAVFSAYPEINSITLNSNPYFHWYSNVLYLTDGTGEKYMVWAPKDLDCGSMAFEDNVTKSAHMIFDNMAPDDYDDNNYEEYVGNKINLGRNSLLLKAIFENNCEYYSEITVKLGSDENGRYKNDSNYSETISYSGSQTLEVLTIESDVDNKLKLRLSSLDNLEAVVIDKNIQIDEASSISRCPKLKLYVYNNSPAHRYAKEHNISYYTID